MIKRLDIRIVLIMLVTVMLPLSLSVYLVIRAIDTSLGLGINDEMATHLEKALDIRREYIQELKRGVERHFAHLTDSHRLAEAAAAGNDVAVKAVLSDFISDNPALSRVRLTDSQGKTIEVKGAGEKDRAAKRPYYLVADVSLGSYSKIEAFFLVDPALQPEYEQAGSTFAAYQALMKAPSNYLQNRFVWVYLAILGTALVVCVAGGIYLARLLVRRIHKLAGATILVAEGDLSVRVDPGTGDEVGQLVESFNRMVSELSVNRARIEYLQKISAWQEMARRLAHEIKNPLTPIQLASQQLREKYAGDDPAFRSLLEQSTDIISEEVATLRRLTSDFAAFAKLPEVRPEAVDLAEFLEECEASLTPVAEQCGVTISFEDRTGGMKLSIDRIMMKRVMDNLVRNASEAITGRGIAQPRICVVAAKRRARKRLEVEIRVEDNGPGVSPEHHPSIFDPYFTTKSEGTGLGLAISKKIVLEHGGRIWLDDQVAEGAAFVLLLPALS